MERRVCRCGRRRDYRIPARGNGARTRVSARTMRSGWSRARESSLGFAGPRGEARSRFRYRRRVALAWVECSAGEESIQPEALALASYSVRIELWASKGTRLWNRMDIRKLLSNAISLFR